MPPPQQNQLDAALTVRFGEAPDAPRLSQGAATLAQMAGRRSCRSFTDVPVDPAMLHTLSAVALSAPSKSDLQQRDIILLTDPAQRAKLAGLVAGQPWVAEAPALLVFCGNNRRQRLLHDWRGLPFANDHLDAFFNAAVDAAIALSAFVTAAEAAGLGCCPISAVRNEAAAVSEMLELPDHVFPVAGLAVGHPKATRGVSMRLPLSVTVHENGYQEADLQSAVEAYCARRGAAQPYATQRLEARLGTAANYDWVEDKARQYSVPERADFGSFIKGIGFRLE